MPARGQRRLPGTKDRIVLLSEAVRFGLSPEERAQARDIEITTSSCAKSNSPWPDYLCIKPWRRSRRIPSSGDRRAAER